MGFFDKLFNTINDVKNSIDKVSDIANKQQTSKPQPQAPQVQTQPAPKPVVEYHDYSYNYNTDDNYFASIINEADYPGYTISRNVSASVFDSTAHPKCYPVSYLLSNGTQPALAVFIMNTNQYRSMIAKGTYEILDNNGIRYIRFFKGMKNDRNYVVNRIKENLK